MSKRTARAPLQLSFSGKTQDRGRLPRADDPESSRAVREGVKTTRAAYVPHISHMGRIIHEIYANLLSDTMIPKTDLTGDEKKVLRAQTGSSEK
jgi:hypothetical protein